MPNSCGFFPLQGSFHPLNPVDPCGSKLTIKDMMSAKLHSIDTADGDQDKEQQLLEQHHLSTKCNFDANTLNDTILYSNARTCTVHVLQYMSVL